MREIFQIDKRHEGSKKVVPLKEAIEKSIEPGMKLHLSNGAYANASLREIIRQYLDKDPKFTLISSGVTTPFEIGLALSGVVRKIITTNHSYIYPTPRPIPLLRKMHQEEHIEIEEWSLLSLEQRLMAGAMGVGFLPTRALMGTNLAEENTEDFKITTNPFDKDMEIGAVRALLPDISLIHGCVADSDGNAILSPPYFTSIWGPRASRGGIVLTVDKVVSSEFIRQHSALVKIPGFMVKYVCEVPLGAHPQGMVAESIGIEGGYSEDYEFINSSLGASKDSGSLREWLEEWVIGCPDQDEYLRKLGHERISFLKGESKSEDRREKETDPGVEPVTHEGFNPAEMMIVTAAREIKEIIKKNDYKTVLSGIGSPGLAAWLAFYVLRGEGFKVDLLTGLGQVGFMPRPGDPFLMSLSNLMTCSMLTDAVEIYGTFVGGMNNRCLSVLGTAQIDKFGNINTVKIDGSPLIGVGGAGDAVNALETLVMTKQSRKRLMEKVSYIGCPGKNIKTLVTDLGVFKKLHRDETFTLTKRLSSTFPGESEDRLREIRDQCGWELDISDALEEVLPPTTEELSILRSLDPGGLFINR
ncbi:MAG: hypothetical protein JRJ06_05425 [Deltaproteobacteria bacterium]|nr:hypothetical protein [Deltaproteobacteria bacterium]